MILTALTALMYPIIVQYRRGGFYYSLFPLALLFVLIDVISNYTEWWYVFGRPAKGDWTLTHRLRRMQFSDPMPYRRDFARMVNTFLHACEHDGKH